MKIIQLEISEIGELASTFNSLCAQIPYVYEITPDEFETGIYFPPYVEGIIESEKIFVSEHNGKRLGFSHVAIEKREGESKVRGVFRFFVYHPEYRQAGQMLLDKSQEYLCKIGAACISTPMKSYRIWATRVSFSGQLLQVPALFQANGYEVNVSSVMMACPGFQISNPDCPYSGVEIVLLQQETPAILPSYIIQMRQGDQKLGQSYLSSLGHYYRASEAQHIFYVNDIYLEPHARGKGLGRYLLERSMFEMQRLGYKDGALCTDIDNYQAQLLYSSYGFRTIDTIHTVYRKP